MTSLLSSTFSLLKPYLKIEHDLDDLAEGAFWKAIFQPDKGKVFEQRSRKVW